MDWFGDRKTPSLGLKMNDFEGIERYNVRGMFDDVFTLQRLTSGKDIRIKVELETSKSKLEGRFDIGYMEAIGKFLDYIYYNIISDMRYKDKRIENKIKMGDDYITLKMNWFFKEVTRYKEKIRTFIRKEIEYFPCKLIEFEVKGCD